LGEIIDDKGWEWFRKTEQLVLFELLKIDNVWISLGGGTLNDKTCEKLSVIDDLQIFWLDATFDQCWQRIQNDKSRPMSSLGHDKLQELYEQRAEIYKNYPKLNLKL
jgi:shikimate kinase